MEEGRSFDAHGTRYQGMSTRALIGAILAAFLLGGAAVFFATGGLQNGIGSVFNIRSDDPDPQTTAPEDVADEAAALAIAEPSPTPQVDVVAQEAREAVERVEQVAEQTGGIDQRVAAMEQRLTRLDLQSQAAAGNAARAEGMLIAFASRRAIERGQPLGFLEDQLRLRFGDARPNAVQTILAASQDPVTVDQLMVRLDGMANDLTDVPEGEGLWTRFKHEFSQLFAVRTDDTPSPVAERRLERARSNLEIGRVEVAIAEVRAMPNAAAAQDWLVDAERYAAAQRALEVLETAAVLEPRELRDAEGERVEQPSPAN